MFDRILETGYLDTLNSLRQRLHLRLDLRRIHERAWEQYGHLSIIGGKVSNCSHYAVFIHIQKQKATNAGGNVRDYPFKTKTPIESVVL